jgi:hypothetical protein
VIQADVFERWILVFGGSWKGGHNKIIKEILFFLSEFDYLGMFLLKIVRILLLHWLSLLNIEILQLLFLRNRCKILRLFQAQKLLDQWTAQGYILYLLLEGCVLLILPIAYARNDFVVNDFIGKGVKVYGFIRLIWMYFRRIWPKNVYWVC